MRDAREYQGWRGTLLMRQRFVCPLCETLIADPKTAHVDHVVPLSRGGSNHHSNLQATHARCNHRKRDRRMEELDLPFPPPNEEAGRWGHETVVVRTGEIGSIERLRHTLACMWGRKVDRREAVDVAVLQIERNIHAGLPVAPDIPEITFRKHGGRIKQDPR